jgi:hypothetical protein
LSKNYGELKQTDLWVAWYEIHVLGVFVLVRSQAWPCGFAAIVRFSSQEELKANRNLLFFLEAAAAGVAMIQRCTCLGGKWIFRAGV